MFIYLSLSNTNPKMQFGCDLGDKIAHMCCAHYKSNVKKSGKPITGKEWTVMAAVVEIQRKDGKLAFISACHISVSYTHTHTRARAHIHTHVYIQINKYIYKYTRQGIGGIV